MFGYKDKQLRPATDGQARAIYRRITLRVVPFLILLYLVAFLDRVNISFASLTMNRDLHIDADVFGLAAGIFFVGYLIFAVPSNLMLVRLGARRWIAIMMVSWGTLSCLMAFVHGTKEYLALRFLIGAAEAGFFPGMILYLTTWLPGSVRAGTMALFTFSIPLSNIVGAPLSAAILQMGAFGGLRPWQSLFLLEGLPAVLLGFVVPIAMANGPESVAWLSDEEKRSLREQMAREEADQALPGSVLPGVATTPKLVVSGLVYFSLMVGLYGLGFWMPRILASQGVGLRWLGWTTALPFAAGACGMLMWSRTSDRSGAARRHLVAAFLLAAAGMAVTGLAASWPTALVGLSTAAVGILAAMPIFWARLSQHFSGKHAAFAIAVVNSVGNIGGFLGPYGTGWLLKLTHGYRAGLLATSACLVGGGALVWLQREVRSCTI